MYNPLLLVAAVCLVVALIFYLFYWNRFIAYILTLVFRVGNWNKGASSIWIDIGSIHFSLLAGRILLRDVRYHSSNQTVKIVKAQITWRYWIRRPADEEDLNYARVGGEDKDTMHDPSCRVQIFIQGYEWLLYNRTAAYDNIIAQMEPVSSGQPASRIVSTEPRQASVMSSSRNLPSASRLVPFSAPQFARKSFGWVKQRLPTLDPKDLLPLGIEVTKGAIICGNPSTPELLVGEFQRADGTFGIIQSRSKYDLYKQVLSLKFRSALIRYVENEDYHESMTKTGLQVQEHVKKSKYSELPRLSFSAFAKLWRNLRLLSMVPQRHTSQSSHEGSLRVRGRSRKNVEEETPVGPASATQEYAVERKILETPLLELSYYADVVGNVPSHSPHARSGSLDPFDIGNGDLPPEWGIDLVVRSGVLRYGPWADRQRAEVQRAFFPPTFHDLEPTPHLRVGDSRMWTSLKLFIELRDDTTLYIPFREASKNWQWDGKTQVPRRPRKREPASIHITAGDSSSISYVIPMVAGATGYESRLEVHLDEVSITSSLNDMQLLTAESCRIRGDLPTPLQWNAERQWMFAVVLRLPVLYLLRDHINMFTDLGKDWTSGPPTDYHRFVPVIYAFELDMHHFDINLYVNDHNIIDKPLIRDENAIFTICGASLHSEAQIPSNTFRPETTTIPFFIQVPDVTVYLSLPRWNTHSLRSPPRGNILVTAGFFRIGGWYCYHSQVRDENVEQLKLDILARDVAYKAVGWSIRHLMVLRDNYVGSFTQFSTLSEYLGKPKNGLPIGDPILLKYREGSANVLNVEIKVDLENGVIMQPAGIPGYEMRKLGQDHSTDDIKGGACVILTVPRLQVQFRLHDYYMEMSINVDTIFGHIEKDYPDIAFFRRPGYRSIEKTFVIDGIDITANRLFGPQPRTPTYLCIWEVHVGNIKTVASALQLNILMAVGNAFRLGFTDALNAPATEYAVPVDPDVTFLKFSLGTLEITWLAETVAARLSLPQGLRIDSNDLAVTVLLLERNCWLDVAELITDLNLDIYSSPRGWKETARAQGEFIEAQDFLTRRARNLFDTLDKEDKSVYSSARNFHRTGLYLPQPQLSDAVNPRNADVSQQLRNEPKPNVSSRVSHSSDSDGETGVSEADRDARLAKSRSMTPTVSGLANDYEANMTSGDESDNEDLTDADTSDSDWSELKPSVNGNGTLPSLAQYRRWTRHYTARFLTDPSRWHGSPFVLARDHRPFFPRSTPRGPDFPRISRRSPGLHSIAVDSDDEVDITTVRLRCCKELEIKILPPVLLAIARLEEQMEGSAFGPELFVDSMIGHYLSIFPNAQDGAQSTMIDAHLSAARIQVLQRYLTAEGSPDGLDYSGAITNVLINIHSSGWDLRANVTHVTPGNARTAFSIASDDLSVTLMTVTDNGAPRRQSHTSPGSVFTFFLGGLHIHLIPSTFGITSESMSIDFDYNGPEYVAATTVALGQNIHDLSRIQAKWRAYTSARSQVIIYQILAFSDAKSIIDPLTTIQPSYLVQGGRPNKLRTDTTFRFLMYLRTCLWHLDERERAMFRSHADVAGKLEDLEHLINSRLLALTLDADGSTVPNASTLEALLSGSQLSAWKPRTDPSFVFASVELQLVRLVVRGPSGLPPSEIVLTPLSITGRMHNPGVIHYSTYNALFSQTSLKERKQRNMGRITASISLGDVTLDILPHLLRFAQQILRVQRHYSASSVSASPPGPVGMGHLESEVGSMYGDFTFSLRHFRIRAAAENLTFELGASRVNIASTVFMRPTISVPDQSWNSTVVFDNLFLRARSTSDVAAGGDLDILASLIFDGGRVSVVIRREQLSQMVIRAAWSLQGSHLNVPRSAIRLYRFVDEWRGDFLPDIEATFHELVSELQNAPAKPASPTPSSYGAPPILQVNGYVTSLGMSLQIMHGTWLSWEIHHTVLYLRSTNGTSRPSRSFGLQVGSQVFTITSKSGGPRETTPTTRLKLVLPTLSLTGKSDGLQVYALASVDFFRAIVRPSHWDTLLAVQQKFGQDFNDLVSLIEETSRRRTPRMMKDTLPSETWKYSGHLKMRGFRIGLEGLSSIVYLDCEDIGGGLCHDTSLTWHIKLSNLALSLASRATVDPRDAFNRKHRSAFVIIDFRVGGGGAKKVGSGTNKAFGVDITKVHAVMQPSSIGEVGDFIDHLQAEMLERKEQRALELQAFKEKTRSVMKTFEVKARDEPPEPKPSWLSQYSINLNIRNVGVAWPLALDRDLELPQTGSGDSSAVRAFLLSIKSIAFGTQRGESGHATMEDFAFQFIPLFRQSSSSDFSGDQQTRNRLVYPQMTAQLRSDTAASSRQIRVAANVSGFILDIDSSIPDYVFSLIDVYRQGTERMARLANGIPGTSSHPESGPLLDTVEIEKKYTAVPTSNIFASMTFLSGKVRLHSGSASKLSKARSLSTNVHEPTDEQFLEFGAEIFKLPVVSVWAEYRATPASHKLGTIRQPEPSILLFKSTIHSSENTLRPTLLPFLTEIVTHLEARMRKISSRSPHPPPLALPSMPPHLSQVNDHAPGSVSSMQISFSLRIDQSKLELTCQPDVNVIAGLHWDSGGFVVNIAPGARKVTFTGSVGGLAAGLKHGFLSEDCVTLNARNLAFSATFAKIEVRSNSVSSMSVVLDTQFSGGVRFSRLQDVLCFKAVWLDRIPIFTGPETASRTPSKSSISLPSSTSRQEFTTALLIRIREIRLDIDLGQSISAVTLDLKNALLRTRLTEALYEVSLSVADVAILARGNVSGQANVSDCIFQTIRRRECYPLEGRGTAKMLELSLTSGALEIIVESDHQKLLQYRAEPLEVEIFDDWSMLTSQSHVKERLLRLAFTVSGSEIVAVATVGTIPKVISYANKFLSNLDSQRDGAARESDAFRVTRSPRPDNPLSEVANAMLHSARNRFKEAEAGLSYMIRQHMSLRLNLLRLVVFPRTMEDVEMAQFIGRDVHARLDRIVQSDGLPAKRDLHLAFSSMTISKFSQLNHMLPDSVPAAEKRLALLLKDATEANIVGLPSMNMHMSSEETVDKLSKNLIYDFDSQFVRREGNRDLEDIYITLNVSLYSWLTVLKKNLTREMDQALAASDSRTASTSVALPLRRKAPEPLQIPDLPAPSGWTPGPHSRPPSSYLAAPSMGLSKSASSALPSPIIPSKSSAIDYPVILASPSKSTPPSMQSPSKAATSSTPFPSGGLPSSAPAPSNRITGIVYHPRNRNIERLTMRQLGDATPDVMHPFFMKKAGFNLEDSLPQYVHEYASIPLEEIMEALLKLYSKQLLQDELEAAADAP